MPIPLELQRLTENAREAVQEHPRHELSQDNRRKIYDLLFGNPDYERTGKWLAITTARRVQPIYELYWRELMVEDAHISSDQVKIATKSEEGDYLNFIVRSVANGYLSVLENLYYSKSASPKQYASRQLDIAEDVLKGLLAQIYADSVSCGFYYEVKSWEIQRKPLKGYFAFMAAHTALITVAGHKPLNHRIAKPVGSTEPIYLLITDDKSSADEGSSGYISSDHWTDEALVEEGDTAADFAVYAAYASARHATEHKYNTVRFKEFWEWWLKEAIPQAWVKAKPN